MRLRLLVFAAALGLNAAPCQAGETHRAEWSDRDWDRVEVALARKDNAEARRLAEEMASTGNPEALNNLSVLVANGVGAPANAPRARALLERAVAGGSTAAKLNLATSLAAASDETQWPRAMSLLQDVIKDPKLAAGTYYPLGRIMLFGRHGPDEMRQGVEMLKKAVEFDSNNADAQYLVGRAFQNGWGGTEKDPKQAFSHFMAAAEAGDSRGRRYVGMARLIGDGVDKDPARALADFEAAAGQGNLDAMIDIGVMLATGEGVPPDPLKAREWYDKAAARGSAHALRGLGAMLYYGEGGTADRVKGRALVELAAAAGDREARVLEKEYFGDPTPDERASLDQAKADWLKAHPKPVAD